MPKRPFVRANGQLIDSFPAAKSAAVTTPSSVEQRLPKEAPPPPARVPEEAQYPAKPLVELVEHAPSELHRAIDQLVSVGGAHARAELRTAFDALVNDPRCFSENAADSERGFALQAVAKARVRMEGDAVDAAAILIRLLAHPRSLVRTTTAFGILQVVRLRDPSPAHRDLTVAMASLATTPDDELFLRAAPVMLEGGMFGILERLRQLLAHDDVRVRESAFGAVRKAPGWVIPRCLAMVRDRLADETAAPLRVKLANWLAPMLSDREIFEHATRALSDEAPSVREAGARLLEHLPASVAAELARDALADEPDESLRILLQSFAGA